MRVIREVIRKAPVRQVTRPQAVRPPARSGGDGGGPAAVGLLNDGVAAVVEVVSGGRAVGGNALADPQAVLIISGG